MTRPTVPSEAVEAMEAALIAAWNEWDAIAGRDSGAHTVFQHAAIRMLQGAKVAASLAVPEGEQE